MQKTINCNGNLLDLSRPRVMGILNLTPDSFYDGGKYTETERITARIKEIFVQKADIIDIGAFSSRPGAVEVSVEEEKKRLGKGLEIIRKLYPEAIVSVDTYRSEIVKFAHSNFKIDIVNDIFAGRADDKMFQTVSDLNLAYVMMHMQGKPSNMQDNPHYQNIVTDILKFFSERIKKATLLGINDIIIDPGFGFGKTIDHNYELLAKLDEFINIVDYPVLVGISRKSMIYKYLNITPDQALPGTIALNTVALQKGASILRVHDVAEAVQTVNVFLKLKQNAD